MDPGETRQHGQRQRYTQKRGHLPTHFIPYHGGRREICKTQFWYCFNVSRRVQGVAKAKAQVAVASPLSPMKSPVKQAAGNGRRATR